jgi:hypothetical protein
MLWERILYSLIAITIGTLALKFNYVLVNSTFRLEWIESKLGPGSTYLVYKLAAIALVLGGILYLTFGGAFFNWLFSPLRGFFPQL